MNSQSWQFGSYWMFMEKSPPSLVVGHGFGIYEQFDSTYDAIEFLETTSNTRKQIELLFPNVIEEITIAVEQLINEE